MTTRASPVDAFDAVMEAARAGIDAPFDRLAEIGGRMLQLRIDGRRRLRLSTPVLLNDGASAVPDVAIAEFNAFHLLAGGYRLLVEERTSSLYVEQALNIRREDADSLRRHAREFVERASACSRWLLDLAATPEPSID